MCAASASFLMFVDESNVPYLDVFRLDCSAAEHTSKLIRIIIPQLLPAGEITCAPNEKKLLLIVTDGDKVFAYNTEKNKQEWSTKVHGGFSITTDGHNYVLVCSESDISMLSLTDGKNLGYLKRKLVKGLGKLQGVRWCNASSSLVVAHRMKYKYSSSISAIQFE